MHVIWHFVCMEHSEKSFFFFNIISSFGQEACGILVPQPGLEPVLPALEAQES